jgi:hypothetical protein
VTIASKFSASAATGLLGLRAHKYQENSEGFVEPYNLSSAEVNRNLAHAGLFLVAYELVKELVVKRVKGFYEGVTFGEGMPFKSYDEDVLARHKNVFEASLLYLRDHFQAISSEDLDAIQMLRQHRNRIAHDLPRMLPHMDAAASDALLSSARESLFRLSNFWVYIDIGADPAFKSQNIDWETVAGADLALLDRIIEQVRGAN